MSRSYFGKDPSWFDWDGKHDDMFKKGAWKAEFEASEKAIKEVSDEPLNMQHKIAMPPEGGQP